MRITRESLWKLARETVTRRVREDSGVMAAYLCGSLLEDDFMLGGVADIDLVFVHIVKPSLEREIVALSEEVHLDIAHYDQRAYRRTRELRLHPWWGPTLAACTVLHDPQHFLDFTQASVRGQFDRPDRVVARARQLLGAARQVWSSYQAGVPDPGPQDVEAYLRAIRNAANAVASLSGPPLTERRFLLRLYERAQALDRPGLYAGTLGLLGAADLSADQISSWMSEWQAVYREIQVGEVPARLHPNRQLYYQRAFDAILAGERPLAVLWPLLRTWTLAADLLPPGSPGRDSWGNTFAGLNLLGGDFAIRISALDAYLDLIEETLENWAQRNGVWSL
jgi:hypothetical protein